MSDRPEGRELRSKKWSEKQKLTSGSAAAGGELKERKEMQSVP